jgi:hypothetical protein
MPPILNSIVVLSVFREIPSTLHCVTVLMLLVRAFIILSCICGGVYSLDVHGTMMLVLGGTLCPMFLFVNFLY